LSVVVIVGETPVPPPPTVINIFGAVICPNPGFVIVTVFGTPFTTAQVAVALIPPAGGTNNDKVGSVRLYSKIKYCPWIGYLYRTNATVQWSRGFCVFAI